LRVPSADDHNLRGLIKNTHQALLSSLPVIHREKLRRFRQWVRDLSNDIADHIGFTIWIFLRCAESKKRAVIIRRPNAIGDVVCTLPVCVEIRKIHKDSLVVFLTTKYSEDIVRLSNAVDFIYSARSTRFRVFTQYFGLIEKVYNPQMPEEYSDAGSTLHLVDEFAKSCGVTVTDRQPHLYPSAELLIKTRLKYALEKEAVNGRLVIGINCGPTWPVREWDVKKWQQLIDRISMEHDPILIQFGIHVSSKENQYDELKGTCILASRLRIEELVALVATCDLLVSIDSGPVHIAGAVGTPVIGLFGAVDPRLRLPPESKSVGIISNVPCLFCHHKTPIGHWKSGCPHNIQCMKRLDVEAVFEVIKQFLQATINKHGEFI
jgi:ADP-heptose:LPS heptosyltransferase